MTKKSTQSRGVVVKKGTFGSVLGGGGHSKDGSRTMMSTKSGLPSRKPTNDSNALRANSFEPRGANIVKKLTKTTNNDPSPVKPTPDQSTSTLTGPGGNAKLRDVEDLGAR